MNKDIIDSLENYKVNNKVIDEITEILQNKWEELEKEELEEKNITKLMDIVVNLDAINDFEKEYAHSISEGLKRKLSGKEIESVLFSVYEKWTFIFCAILNLDLTNPFVLTYMHEALMGLMEEE